MTEIMKEKNCCFSQPIMMKTVDEDYYFVCPMCERESKRGVSLEIAIEKWNNDELFVESEVIEMMTEKMLEAVCGSDLKELINEHYKVNKRVCKELIGFAQKEGVFREFSLKQVEFISAMASAMISVQQAIFESKLEGLKAKDKDPCEYTEDLRDCPFCGAEDDEEGLYLHENKHSKEAWVICDVCGASGPDAHDGWDARKKWNERGLNDE